MLHVSSRKARIPKDDDCNVISDSIKERTKSMMERSEALNTTSFETVLHRIRSSAMEKLEEIHNLHQQLPETGSNVSESDAKIVGSKLREEK